MWPSGLLKKICEAFLHSTEDLPLVPFRYQLRYNRGLASRPRPTAQSSCTLHGALPLFHQNLKNQQTGADPLVPSPASPSILFSPTSRATTTIPRGR